MPPRAPIPFQSEAKVEIRIGAEIGARRVVPIAVRVVGRGGVMVVRGRQCAGSGGEDDGQSKCGLGKHDIRLLVVSYELLPVTVVISADYWPRPVSRFSSKRTLRSGSVPT